MGIKVKQTESSIIFYEIFDFNGSLINLDISLLNLDKVKKSLKNNNKYPFREANEGLGNTYKKVSLDMITKNKIDDITNILNSIDIEINDKRIKSVL